METDLVVLGIALIVLGIIAAWICCFGGILILIGAGIILFAFLQEDEGRKHSVYYRPLPPASTGQGQGESRSCPYCDRIIPSASVVCPYCGTKLDR